MCKISVQKITLLRLLIFWSLLCAVTAELDMMRENIRATLYTLPYPNSFIVKKIVTPNVKNTIKHTMRRAKNGILIPSLV